MQQFLVVGLGNPGEKYATTRHNAGFMALDFCAQTHDATFGIHNDLSASVARVHTPSYTLLLAKPTTFMNLSGVAVQKLCAYYKISLSHLVVVHDDSDLHIGTYRFHVNRGAAGHNGVSNIITHLKTQNFWRVRIGVRPHTPDGAPRLKAHAFVLNPFVPEERNMLNNVLDNVHATLCRHFSPQNTIGSKK